MKLPLAISRLTGFISRTRFGNQAFTSVSKLVVPRQYEVIVDNCSFDSGLQQHYIEVNLAALTPTWPGGQPANFIHFVQCKGQQYLWGTAPNRYGYNSNEGYSTEKVPATLSYQISSNSLDSVYNPITDDPLIYTVSTTQIYRQTLSFNFALTNKFRLTFVNQRETVVDDPHGGGYGVPTRTNTFNNTTYGYFLLPNPTKPTDMSQTASLSNGQHTNPATQTIRHIFRFDTPGTPEV